MNSEYSGMRVVVMGLGLNGGGLESARYLAAQGAIVTVTDLRSSSILAASIEKLAAFPIRYVLERHEMDDFLMADMVIKNPAVPGTSPFLRAARRVETDLSLFLAACPARICAVTGSKGKSSTSSALHWAQKQLKAPDDGASYLGGNITLSPLSFLDQLHPEDDVVLELSSWQLGDLRGRLRDTSTALLKPRVAIITSILPDHLDRYESMEAYVGDKMLIYAGQDGRDATVIGTDTWGRLFAGKTPGRPLIYAQKELPQGIAGGWIDRENGRGFIRGEDGSPVELLPSRLLVPGAHQRMNLLSAGLALWDLGFSVRRIGEALSSFPGIEHRLEFFHEKEGILFYNDTAATIPEAAAAAIEAFDRPPIVISGGTDKALDFSPLAAAAGKAKGMVLLAGTGTDKLIPLLEAAGTTYRGPFHDLTGALQSALELAEKGDTVILSPGCTSFGMFINEFDRGRKWKEAVRSLS